MLSSWSLHGGVAQLGERLLCKQNVASSILVTSTILNNIMTTFLSKHNNWYKEHYNLSDNDVEQLIAQFPSQQYTDETVTVITDLVNTINSKIDKEARMVIVADSLPAWIKSYNNIKGSDWPNCSSFEDFNKLPVWIKTECEEIFNFSFTSWKEGIYEYLSRRPLSGNVGFWSDAENQLLIGKTNLQHLIRLKLNILDNIELIKDKNVLEFSCQFGDFTFASLDCGANHVACTDIRDDNLTVAKLRANLLGCNDRVTFSIADLHDYTNNTQICQKIDTVILCGVMYHVHDHYSILESITSGNPESIIIEGIEKDNIIDDLSPLIHWQKEYAYSLGSGYHETHDKFLVGFPNEAWYDMTMDLFGYKKIRRVRMPVWTPDALNEEHLEYRGTYTYQRISQTKDVMAQA